ncbi:hypothetical protein FisN_4Hu575 [Fistulifera solaris]|uniref:Uncharacterized protein n=1 Tax=Fistulifera solaris TaxID=1519565 RepID=A0A1Z5K5S6_FISSO|nr:hypothetical protein FisN_4Hu575 [Fistulifera solaris]|eukprot:GAX21512.1 hypothetical protein FisN_4Hu575 [Fistulifera solaris]
MILDRQTGVEILAGCMDLCTISEHRPTYVGFRSSFSPTTSGESLSNGWGNAVTRKSYKTDLCSLASSCTYEQSEVKGPQLLSAATDNEDEAWGFFMGSI